MKAAVCGIALLFAATSQGIGQDGIDSAASRSLIIAYENAWGQAERAKDAKVLDALLDNSLAYTDYDGSLKTKGDFLASVKAVGHSPEVETVESMSAHVYGDSAVVIGIYTVKGIDKNKPYNRRGTVY